MIIPADKREEYLEALQHPHTKVVWAEIFTGSSPIATRIKVIDGSITADSTQDVRYSGSVTLDFDLEHRFDLTTSLLNVYTTRIAIYSSIVGINEDPHIKYDNPLTVPMGMYRVENTSRTDLGVISLDLGGLEGYVIDDQFTTPLEIDPKSTKPENIFKQVQIPYIIRTLIKEAFGGSISVDLTGIEAGSDSWRPVSTYLAFERSRWEAVENLAESINCVVYAGADGRFYVKDKPAKQLRYQQFPYTWIVNKGNTGVLTQISSTATRDNVYNAVVASINNPNPVIAADGTETEAPAVTAIVRDTDPASPVRWDGPFGHKPLFLDPIEFDASLGLASDLGALQRQAAWYALYRLNDAFGENREMSFNAVSNYALEPDDLVYVETPANIFEKHQLVQIQFPLTSGEMSATTKSKSDLKFMVWGEITPHHDTPGGGNPFEYIWDRQLKRWRSARRISDLV